MTRYYLIRLSSDQEVVGIDDGGSQARIGKDSFNKAEDYDQLMRVLGSNEYWSCCNKLNDFSMKIDRVNLINNAVLTDAVSFDPVLINCPFLLSEKAVKVIQEVDSSGLTLIEASLFYEDVEYPYFVTHFSRIPESAIDYEKSTFIKRFDPLASGEVVKFRGEKERQDYCLNNFDLEVDELFIRANGCENTDIFSVYTGDVFVSERIMELFSMAGVTGLQMLPAYGGGRNWPSVEIL